MARRSAAPRPAAALALALVAAALLVLAAPAAAARGNGGVGLARRTTRDEALTVSGDAPASPVPSADGAQDSPAPSPEPSPAPDADASPSPSPSPDGVLVVPHAPPADVPSPSPSPVMVVDSELPSPPTAGAPAPMLPLAVKSSKAPADPNGRAAARKARREARKAQRKAKRAARKAARKAKRAARIASGGPSQEALNARAAVAAAATPSPKGSFDNVISSCTDLQNKIAQISDAASTIYSGPGDTYTLTLDCNGKFNDCDPMTMMQIEGRTKVNIQAGKECSTGDSRPVLTVSDLSATDGERFLYVYGYYYDYYSYHATAVTSVSISNVIFDCAGTRSGVQLIWANSAKLTNVDFVNCVAENDYDGEGAALRVENCQASLNKGKMSNNRAFDGGAVYLYNDEDGAGLTMTGVEITNNTASNSVAGAIYLYKDATNGMYFKCSGCNISNNAAVDTGAVLYSERYDTTNKNPPTAGATVVVDLRSTTFADNSAGDNTEMCGYPGETPFRKGIVLPRSPGGAAAAAAKKTRSACSNTDCTDFCYMPDDPMFAPKAAAARALGRKGA